MLEAMWRAPRSRPPCSTSTAARCRDISTKCLSSASGPLLHYYQQPNGAPQVSGGGIIEFYYNPFLLDGGVKIPIKIHPYVPPGTILGWCEDLPAQYQNSDVPNVAEVKCRQDYYAIDWPITTRQRQKGVYCEGGAGGLRALRHGRDHQYRGGVAARLPPPRGEGRGGGRRRRVEGLARCASRAPSILRCAHTPPRPSPSRGGRRALMADGDLTTLDNVKAWLPDMAQVTSATPCSAA